MSWFQHFPLTFSAWKRHPEEKLSCLVFSFAVLFIGGGFIRLEEFCNVGGLMDVLVF